MARVTGIGGVFFKARDPEALRAWYKRHLEVDVQAWGGAAFNWQDDPAGVVLAALRAEGCAVDDKTEESEFGKFGWVTDPEGNRVELWQPPPGRVPG